MPRDPIHALFAQYRPQPPCWRKAFASLVSTSKGILLRHHCRNQQKLPSKPNPMEALSYPLSSRAKPRDLRCAPRSSRILRTRPQHPNRIVIPTGAAGEVEGPAVHHPQHRIPMEAPPSPLSSRPRISCPRSTDKAACAPLRKEGRMMCVNPIKFRRKSGGAKPRDLQFSRPLMEMFFNPRLRNPKLTLQLFQRDPLGLRIHSQHHKKLQRRHRRKKRKRQSPRIFSKHRKQQ
jgi:hypothetical protein